MNITMIGTGYVGLVTGTCLAESGNDVTCVDIDQAKIDRLRKGDIPIYEPGLSELVLYNSKSGRLKFTTSAAEAVPTAKCVFIAVGTPQRDDGSANLDGLWKVVDTLAPLLPADVVVVIKSTVPVGTNRAVAQRLQKLTGRVIDVASNPEFLKEGCAIDDFAKPDRVVVGVERPEVGEVLHDLYKPFLRTEHPFLTMGLESAEMTKYVANCLLATKISFINEMANLCERLHADINDVRRGIGHDQRIGFSFLFPGVGYGGSCFPKDVRALVDAAAHHNLDTKILKAVDEVNNNQKHVLFEKIRTHFAGGLKGRTIAIWGLSFKPRTDDIREAPALVLIDALLEEGAVVRVHDPVALPNVRQIYGEKLIYSEKQYDALEGAEALAIVTEWNEFRNANFELMQRTMKQPVIFDGRNLYDPARMQAQGFTYSGVGLLVPPSHRSDEVRPV
jgi:UDPglucose 6-dehydrogenase